MKKIVIVIGLLATVTASVALANDGFKIIREVLTGYEEVPAVSTAAGGEFHAAINGDASQIDYSLSYGNLEGAVQQAHIHLGQKGVNGGIVVFLCSNLNNGPAGTQPCPSSPATVTGTITDADVSPNIAATTAARTQGLGTGEFGELLAAVRAGATYVNVHTDRWPGGEIRRQIDGSGGHAH